MHLHNLDLKLAAYKLASFPHGDWPSSSPVLSLLQTK